jgi:hypothetical protein
VLPADERSSAYRWLVHLCPQGRCLITWPIKNAFPLGKYFPVASAISGRNSTRRTNLNEKSKGKNAYGDFMSGNEFEEKGGK